MARRRKSVNELLADLLCENDYVPILSQRLDLVGFRIEGEELLLRLESETGEMSLGVRQPSDAVEPPCWVECARQPLLMAATNHTPLEVQIHASDALQRVIPQVEKLLTRCFQPPPYPVSDREELVYSTLFGDVTPKVIWQSNDQRLKVLHYERAGFDSYCVSSGLSDPGNRQPAEIFDASASGAGYELVIKTTDPAVAAQFATWVQHVDVSGTDLLPGNWLEFEGGAMIPGTDLVGFLVAVPSSFELDFPVAAGIANWHALLPVNAEQLAKIKQGDVLEVFSAVQGC